MAFAKGNKLGGRKKGSVNKLTAAVKGAIQTVFAGLGGSDKLLEWAKENPAEFYTKLWIKLLPTEVTGADGGPVQLVKVLDLSGE